MCISECVCVCVQLLHPLGALFVGDPLYLFYTFIFFPGSGIMEAFPRRHSGVRIAIIISAVAAFVVALVFNGFAARTIPGIGRYTNPTTQNRDGIV